MHRRLLPFLIPFVLLSVSSLASAAAPTASEIAGRDRWIDATFEFEQPDLTTMQMSGELLIYRYTLGDDVYDALDIGVAYHGTNKYAGRAQGNAFVAEIEQSAMEALVGSLSGTFPDAQITGVSATIDRSTLRTQGGEYDPPVRLSLEATLSRTRESVGLGELSDDAVQAVFDTGASVQVDFPLASDDGYLTTYVIHAPQVPAGLRFQDATGATLATDGSSLTTTIDNHRGDAAPSTVSVTLRNGDAPTYTAQDAELDILVDLKDLDIQLAKAAGGDMGNLLIDVTVTGKLGVIEVPSQFRAAMGERMQLDYLPSDGIRRLLDAGVIGEDDIAQIEQTLLSDMEQRLGSTLGGALTVAGGLDRATLDASRVGASIDGADPIVFTARTSLMKSLTTGEVQPQAAIALYTQHQSFALPKVQGLDTLYTIVLPRGLAVVGLEASGGESETGKSADGRDQFTVRPTDDSAQATVAMAVTPTFVLAKFWPIVLVAVLVVVLVVGTPIALVVSRRKGKA